MWRNLNLERCLVPLTVACRDEESAVRRLRTEMQIVDRAGVPWAHDGSHFWCACGVLGRHGLRCLPVTDTRTRQQREGRNDARVVQMLFVKDSFAEAVCIALERRGRR